MTLAEQKIHSEVLCEIRIKNSLDEIETNIRYMLFEIISANFTTLRIH